MTIRGFNRHDFALSHPAGALGNRLLTTVAQLIEDTHKAAFCSPETTISDTITIMCQTGLGLLAIVKEQKVIGVFTDGDLRRALSASHDLSECIKTVMTTSFTQIAQEQLGSKALDIMHRKGITALPVTDKSGHFYGVMNLNTLQKAGIV
jgi:CBS domain-containing protein